MKSLKLQEDLIRKTSELKQMQNEVEKLWDMPFILDSYRLVRLDEEIVKKKAEIAQIESVLSGCKCYQERQLLQGLTYKKAG